MIPESIALRHQELQRFKIEFPECPGLDSPLTTWLLETDRHFPQAHLGRSLGEVLAVPIEKLLQERGVGVRRVELLISLFDRAITALNGGVRFEPKPWVAGPESNEEPPACHESNIHSRHSKLRGSFLRDVPSVSLDRRLREWVTAQDRHLPQRFTGLPLNDLLKPEVWQEIQTSPGVGEVRLHRLLDVLHRALNDLRGAAALDDRLPPPDEDWTPERWRIFGEHIRDHGWARLPLARFAESLQDLTHGFWNIELECLVSMPLSEALDYLGEENARTESVLETLATLRRLVFSAPGGSLRIGLLARPMARVAEWVARQCESDAIPTEAEVRDRFMSPLLEQVEIDLGSEVRAMATERWGIHGPIRTLDELGQERGITRERVRQLTARVVDVMNMMWPEGKAPMARLLDRWTPNPAARPIIERFRAVVEGCYDWEPGRFAARPDLEDAWRRLGRQKRTPRSEADFERWLERHAPAVPSALARSWIGPDELNRCERGGEIWYFSSTRYDRVLLKLFERGEPMTIPQVRELVGGDDRSLRTRFAADPRFVVDDDHRVHASDHFGLTQGPDGWSVRLDPIASTPPRDSRLNMTTLARILAAGLLDRGIADASVWGVRRHADESLARFANAKLPVNIDAFAFASMLCHHSEGLFRPMRRRRLRWDAEGSTIPARGKLGWLAKIVTDLGKPCLLAEAVDGMARMYQDYEDYVYNQLQLMGEDGEGNLGFTWISFRSKQLPRLLVPMGWAPVASASSVSFGVLALARKLAQSNRHSRYSKGDFEACPWFVDLCEREAGYPLSWATEPTSDALPPNGSD